MLGGGLGRAQVTTVHVDATPGHAINSFDPDRSVGTSIDVLPRGVIDKIYTPHILKESLAVGWGPITYRNNTELRIAAWHWNDDGTWSDATHKSGYFTGDSEPKKFIRYISSYTLPHRGFSYSADGASLVLEGGTKTYWKSNPYLTSRFTGEADSLHPQWVVMDLGQSKQISAIRIAWENPFARTYEVDYWDGRDDAMEKVFHGEWKVFLAGKVGDTQGGTATLKLTESAVSTRFIRVWMMESSNTCDLHGSEDIRNCVGYAISDIQAGYVDGSGAFVDLSRTSPGQLHFYTSSVDPWHSADEIAAHSAQHTGFDLFFTSGITNNLPAMIPVTVLYGTPEDAAAQIAYIKKRGYKFDWIEMGEECDGKKMLPEDYAALYLQWAAAIHKIDPSLKLGGPVFEPMNHDLMAWADRQGQTSWMRRFVDYLEAHGRLSDLTFMSFEHYPYPECSTITWNDLYREPELTSRMLQVWREDGVPTNIPLMITESNVASSVNRAMSELFAALWLADSVGSFFEAGGGAYYHTPIQPEPLRRGCSGGYATFGNFIADKDFHIKGYTSQYYSGRLINLEWLQHHAGVHFMFPASADIKDSAGHVLVTTYAVKRPDGNWALMLVNRDEFHPHTVSVELKDSKSQRKGWFSGPVTMVTFGRDQYAWRDLGPDSHPDPHDAPVTKTISGSPQATYTLPKASVTVLRGEVPGLGPEGSRQEH
jgi:hypothetical protein